MFSCYLHSWFSGVAVCPACNPVETFASGNSVYIPNKQTEIDSLKAENKRLRSVLLKADKLLMEYYTGEASDLDNQDLSYEIQEALGKGSSE